MQSEMRVEIAARLRRSAEYRRLLDEGGRLERLPPPAAAWVLGLLSEELDRPLLMVTPHESEAIQFREAARLMDLPAELFVSPSLTPYKSATPSMTVQAREVEVLDRLLAGSVRTVVATPRALFRILPTPDTFAAAVLALEKGREMPIEELTAALEGGGYRRRDVVTDLGEYAVRGGIVDCYPPGTEQPVRIDYFGDQVDSLRAFDVDDQRSRRELAAVRLSPVTFFSHPEALVRVGRALADEELGYEASRSVEAARRGEEFPGWQNYLPLLAAERATLADWLGVDAITAVVTPTETVAEIERHAAALESEYTSRREAGQLAVAPDRLEHSLETVRSLVEQSAVLLDDLGSQAHPASAIDFQATLTDLFYNQLPRFPVEVDAALERGDRVLVVTGADDQRGRVKRLCEHYSVGIGAGGVEFLEGRLERGFRLPPVAITVFSEDQLFRRPPAARRGRSRTGSFFADLRDLRAGDFVVHEDHGIGQFVGLRTVAASGTDAPELPPLLVEEAADKATPATEALEICYRDGQVLLLPPSRLDLLQRYAGAEGSEPRLDRLGGTSWARARARVRAGVRKLAIDLLKLYAQRELSEAPRIPPDTDLLAQFEGAFEYEPTQDQLEAIADIKADLESGRPMDRLLCGDVGFGKTEVAMRAACKVVEGGFQVAVLAPTTILADQHFETFRQRFAEFPVEIEMVSRFRSAAEIKRIAERVEKATIDILVGTHRLLSRDIRIPRLGLLVVDEEQRFGVAQKEKLKDLKTNVHVLALTATPAPRTLQLSLAGVRDLSTIATPPRDRQAVETTILPYSDELVREAVEHELDRGGQVYYVYNRIAGIERIAKRLREICPQASAVVGHGQLEEAELARRMHDFKDRKYDLLLATTIIENGIDIPNVNTIIVHQADRFGLAQLYQLRGRVGRSSDLAYCYLLVPPGAELSSASRRRLEAIREFAELGAGFRVAARDLEIRGAGDVLGAEQSGHISSVGIETYLKLLDETVRELKGEKVEETASTAISLPVPAMIPKDYVADSSLRMELYRRIAALGEDGGRDILLELEDRFGAPPRAVMDLVAMAELRRRAEWLRVQSISSRGRSLQVRFRQDTRVAVETLTRFLGEVPEASFSPSGVLTVGGMSPESWLEGAQRVLQRLGP
jgi:transcription-repair coupling factor (superfamily II helicase)